MALSTGDHVLVRLKKDPGQLLHYVIVSDSASLMCHWSLTPSRYTQLVDFSDANVAEIHLFWPGQLPEGILRSDTFLDLDSARGAYQEWEIEVATQLSKSADGAFTVRDEDKPGVGVKAFLGAHAGPVCEPVMHRPLCGCRCGCRRRPGRLVLLRAVWSPNRARMLPRVGIKEAMGSRTLPCLPRRRTGARDLFVGAHGCLHRRFLIPGCGRDGEA